MVTAMASSKNHGCGAARTVRVESDAQRLTVIEYNGRPLAVSINELGVVAAKWPGRVFARFNRRCALAITDARTRQVKLFNGRREKRDQIKACGRWYDCEVVERIYTA